MKMPRLSWRFPQERLNLGECEPKKQIPAVDFKHCMASMNTDRGKSME
jgi:hypothetical protein